LPSARLLWYTDSEPPTLDATNTVLAVRITTKAMIGAGP
jgi:hypothetical protein